MKKLLFLWLFLPLFCFGQTNTTPQFKRNIPADSLLGYSVSGLTGNHWLPDTAWVKKRGGKDLFADANVFKGLGTTSNKLSFRDTAYKNGWTIRNDSTGTTALTLLTGNPTGFELALKDLSNTLHFGVSGQGTIFSNELHAVDGENYAALLVQADSGWTAFRNLFPGGYFMKFSSSAHNYITIDTTGIHATPNIDTAHMTAHPNDYVTAKWVGAHGGSGGGTTYTADGGVVLSGSNFQLGTGTLHASTTLSLGSTNTYTLQNSATAFTKFQIGAAISLWQVTQAGAPLGFKLSASTSASEARMTLVDPFINAGDQEKYISMKVSQKGIVSNDNVDSIGHRYLDTARLHNGKRYDTWIPNWGSVKSRIDSAISAGGGGANIYNIDGSLTGSRALTAGSNSLTLTGDNTFNTWSVVAQASSIGGHGATINIGSASDSNGAAGNLLISQNGWFLTNTNTLGVHYDFSSSGTLVDNINHKGIVVSRVQNALITDSTLVMKKYVDSVAAASGATGANPTATAGKTAVNGSATTFMRSDAAPKIDSTSTGYQTVSNFFPKGDTRYQKISSAFSNPMTTTGDIIYSSSGSTPARLAIGGANTVLHGGTTPSYSSVANADLANSSTTINGTSIALGASATVTAAAGTLTGTTLNSAVVTSSLTSVGTLGGLTVTAAPTFSAMTSGSVLFAGTSGLLSQNNANFFWDNTNKFLGIGTNAPADFLHVLAGTTSGGLTVEETNSGTHSPWVSVKKGTNQVFWSLAGATDSFFIGTAAGDMIFRATTGKNIWLGASDGSTGASLEIVSGGDVKAVSGNLVIGTAGKELKVAEGTNGFAGQTTLVAGTKAITISGVTTSSRAFVQLVSQGGTVTTTQVYAAVCTANTLTITALTNAGSTDTTDTSVLNYFIIN